MFIPSILLAMAMLGSDASAPWTPPAPAPAPALSAGTEIAALLAEQYAAWDAHDFDGYLRVFWRSPNLVYVVEGAVWQGWDEVRGRLTRQYANPANMGHPVLDQLQVRPISESEVTTVEWWTVHFGPTHVSGNSVSTWRRFPEGWRIVQGSTSVNSEP